MSIDPESLQLKNNLLPSQSMCGNQASHSGSNGGVTGPKRAKFIRYPGDVGDNEVLDDATTQHYLSLLRKKVMEKSKLTRALTQQNRRQQQRIVRLKSMLKELIEKTKNGNYIIETLS